MGPAVAQLGDAGGAVQQEHLVHLGVDSCACVLNIEYTMEHVCVPHAKHSA